MILVAAQLQVNLDHALFVDAFSRVIAIINIIIRSQFDHGAPQDQSAHPTVHISSTDFTRDGFSDSD